MIMGTDPCFVLTSHDVGPVWEGEGGVSQDLSVL